MDSQRMIPIEAVSRSRRPGSAPRFNFDAATVRVLGRLPRAMPTVAKPAAATCRHRLYPTSQHCLQCGKSYLEIKRQGEIFDVEHGRLSNQAFLGRRNSDDGSGGECSVPFPVASTLILGAGATALKVASLLLGLVMLYWLVT